MKLINIGFGNMVNANRLVAIVSPESAPDKEDNSGLQGEGNSYRRDPRQAYTRCHNNRQRPCYTYLSAERDRSKPPQQRWR